MNRRQGQEDQRSYQHDTHHEKASAQKGFTVRTDCWHWVHSDRQSRSLSNVAPYRFDPLKASSSADVKCRGVRSLFGEGSIEMYGSCLKHGGSLAKIKKRKLVSKLNIHFEGAYGGSDSCPKIQCIMMYEHTNCLSDQLSSCSVA